jgi:hypothetical protein
LHPQKRRKREHPNSFLPVNSNATTVPPLPTSVETAIQEAFPNNTTLLHTSGLLHLQETNKESSAGVHDSSQPYSSPLSLFDPPQHMLLAYVENMFTQPQLTHDWGSSNFPDQGGFSAI